jgi:hypothetical protein
MAEGWGNSGNGGGEGARMALCTARGRQSLSGASLYSRSFMLLSSMLVSTIAKRTAAPPLSTAVSLSLRPYSSRPPRRDYDSSSSSSSSSYGKRRGGGDSYSSSRTPARTYERGNRRVGNNWGGNSGGASWGGGDGGFQQSGGAGGYGGGQRSTACFNCGQG